MTHTITFDTVSSYAQNTPLTIASSSGPNGHKRLDKVDDFFLVVAGKDTFRFDDLKNAVDKYNKTLESR